MYYFTEYRRREEIALHDDAKDVSVKTGRTGAFVKKCVEDGAAEIKAKGDKA